MIFKSMNSKDIREGRHKSRGEAFQKFTIVDRELIINQQAPEKMRIMKATNLLVRNNYCSFAGENKTSQFQADSLLQTLGCSVVDNADKDFSLMSIQTDTTTVSNPNINNLKDLKNKKNKQIKADKAFPDSADPIYEFDERPSISVELQNKKIERQKKNTQKIRLGSDLAKRNLISSRNALKYFK